MVITIIMDIILVLISISIYGHHHTLHHYYIRCRRHRHYHHHHHHQYNHSCRVMDPVLYKQASLWNQPMSDKKNCILWVRKQPRVSSRRVTEALPSCNEHARTANTTRCLTVANTHRCEINSKWIHCLIFEHGKYKTVHGQQSFVIETETRTVVLWLESYATATRLSKEEGQFQCAVFLATIG